VHVVLRGLSRVLDPQARRVDGGAELGQTTAGVAACSEGRRSLTGEAAAEVAELRVVLGVDPLTANMQ